MQALPSLVSVSFNFQYFIFLEVVQTDRFSGFCWSFTCLPSLTKVFWWIGLIFFLAIYKSFLVIRDLLFLKFMEVVGGTTYPSGYGKPPWIFKGRARYQLHLVKAKTARSFIPKEFRLVEAFGYTLGGFFLASYEDSPAGAFDELVVIAGLVWNPPTSCAWAARVFVNSSEACDHGRKYVGLPSQVAKFTKSITAVERRPKGKIKGFLEMIGFGTAPRHQKDFVDVKVSEIEGPTVIDLCNINLTPTRRVLESDKWRAPAIKMSLPSFSGHTEYYPNLVKYSCQMECRVRLVEPAKVSGPLLGPKEDPEQSWAHHGYESMKSTMEDQNDNERTRCISLMLSKPLIALEFNCMKMRVEAPIEISNPAKTTLEH